MPRFPSDEWIEDFCARLREHPDAAALAEHFAGFYRFVMEPAGPLHTRETYHIEVVPTSGQPDVHPVADAADPRLTVAADYNRWRQLVSGDLDLGLAVMLRRIRVSGDLATLTRGLANTKPLLDALAAVDSQWPESDGETPGEA